MNSDTYTLSLALGDGSMRCSTSGVHAVVSLEGEGMFLDTLTVSALHPGYGTERESGAIVGALYDLSDITAAQGCPVVTRFDGIGRACRWASWHPRRQLARRS